jgi:hypothetical protein
LDLAAFRRGLQGEDAFIAADETVPLEAAPPSTEAPMSIQRSRFCPYCLVALMGTAFLLGIPELANAQTPLGQGSLWLFWLPSGCALLRQGMLRLVLRKTA